MIYLKERSFMVKQKSRGALRTYLVGAFLQGIIIVLADTKTQPSAIIRANTITVG